ncbi:MAG: amidoligase family protein [Armatimonadota bacterium]
MKLQELRFGVEIETVKRRRGDVANAIQSVVGGAATHVGRSSSFDPWEVRDDQNRVWKVVADSSLSNVAPEFRAEVVSPVLTYEDLLDLQDVVRAIRRCGSVVDEKCGMHIHVDASAFDGRSLTNLAKIIHKQEELILTALGVSAERMRRYTKPMSPDFIAKIESSRPKTKEQMNRIWYGYQNNHPEHYDQTRYYGVNFHNVWYRGTVEFRWFAATLHAGKVKAAIQFVLAIAAKALNNRGASSRRRQFDPQSAKYDFRCFLLRLGMNGDEFKTARKHLLCAMPGDAAWKYGRPKQDDRDLEQSEVCDETR